MRYRGVGLIRVSTEEQGNEAAGRAGVLRQRQDILTASRLWNIGIVQTIELIGVSGTSVRESPDFRRMLELLEQPSIDCLVISHLDRVCRPDDFGAFSIFDIFKYNNKLIFTPTGPINVADDPGYIQVSRNRSR